MTSRDTMRAMGEPVSQILSCIRSVFEKTPPELAADILSEGIVLTGGGALLEGLADVVQSDTHIRTKVAKDPWTALPSEPARLFPIRSSWTDCSIRNSNNIIDGVLLCGARFHLYEREQKHEHKTNWANPDHCASSKSYGWFGHGSNHQ